MSQIIEAVEFGHSDEYIDNLEKVINFKSKYTVEEYLTFINSKNHLASTGDYNLEFLDTNIDDTGNFYMEELLITDETYDKSKNDYNLTPMIYSPQSNMTRSPGSRMNATHTQTIRGIYLAAKMVTTTNFTVNRNSITINYVSPTGSYANFPSTLDALNYSTSGNNTKLATGIYNFRFDNRILGYPVQTVFPALYTRVSNNSYNSSTNLVSFSVSRWKTGF